MGGKVLPSPLDWDGMIWEGGRAIVSFAFDRREAEIPQVPTIDRALGVASALPPLYRPLPPPIHNTDPTDRPTGNDFTRVCVHHSPPLY